MAIVAEQLAALVAQTRAALLWLTDAVDPQEPVSFVPNPGNVGDAAINLACWRHLAARFATVEICPTTRRPAHRQVFVGGGGNLVQPLWHDLQQLLEALSPARHRVALFPATLYGYGGLLRRWRGRLRVVCREAVSLDYARGLLDGDSVRLGHDSAFMLADALPGRPREAAPPASRPARFLRGDKEGVVCLAGGDGDLTGRQVDRWLDPARAADAVGGAVARIAACDSVTTDRLHVAILAALLGKDTTLHQNSYFKNRAVYEQSLRQLSWVRFAEDAARRPSTSGNDPLLYQAARARHGATRRLGQSLGQSLGRRLRALRILPRQPVAAAGPLIQRKE